MKVSPIPAIILALISLSVPGCYVTQAGESGEEPSHIEHQEHEHPKVVTSPKAQDVVITQRYVCQIHSRRHIEVRALVEGYLDQVLVKEGQTVKKGELMFKLLPPLYKAELDAKLADVRIAQVKLENAKKLFKDKIVSQVDVKLHEAELANQQAEAKRKKVELDFTEIKAPFDGIVDRLEEFEGSLVEKGDMLTTLSQNDPMWVYFNVPEARYLECMASRERDDESQQIELVLANGCKFPYPGKIAAIEAKFNNETGNIPFRADFPNPEGLLRHGQTGNVLIHRTLENAIVIPQRATFEILDKRYVYVIDKDDVVHQREIVVQNELEDIFVIKTGLDVNDKYVLDGVRQVRDGEKVEYEFRKPDEVLANLKYHAE